MALQTFRSGLAELELLQQVLWSFGSGALTATTHKLAAVGKVPKTGNVTAVAVRAHTVTTSQQMQAGIQTVDATTGHPTGTAYGGMAVGTFTPTAATLHEVTLGTQAAATLGDDVAVVAEFSGTAGSVAIAWLAAGNAGNPYVDFNGTGTYAKQGATIPIVALKYDDGLWYPMTGALPLQAITDTSFGSGTNPNERGNTFSLPAPSELSGVKFAAALTGDCDVVLNGGAYSNVVLGTCDKDVVGSTGNGRIYNLPCAKKTLAANTTYDILVRASTATALTLRQFDLSSAGMMDCYSLGQSMYLVTRNSGASRTTDTAKRAFVVPVLDQFDDAAGGGQAVVVVRRHGVLMKM
jgi:hypothetical protein